MPASPRGRVGAVACNLLVSWCWMPATLALIDGHYYAYRFFFAMPPLTGPGGRPTGVTYAFANLFLMLRTDPAVTHWACVFDPPGDSFRSELDPQYKAHRDPMPDPLRLQIEDVVQLCAGTKVPVVTVPRFEADDVLASLAWAGEAAGMDVRILTKDKDIDQVLTDRIHTWDTFTKDGPALRGPEELLAEKGLTPRQVIDYLCMIGDASDNIPGITGVGPKTALKLLGQYGSLDQVLAHVDDLKGKLQENVRAFLPHHRTTCDLVTLRAVPDLPALDSFAIDRAFTGDEAIYSRFGFKRAKYFPAAATAESTHTRFRIVDAAGLAAFVAAVRTQRLELAVLLEATDPDPLSAELTGIALAAGLDAQGKPGDGRDAIYVPLAGIEHALVSMEDCRRHLGPLLGDATVPKIAHDAKLLARRCARAGLPLAGVAGDTMLASWLLDPSRESHALDYLVRLFLSEEPAPPPEPVLPRHTPAIQQVPVAAVAGVACEEAQCCWRLARLLAAKLAEVDLMEVYRGQELPIALTLAHMEDAGVGIDAEALGVIQRHLTVYLEQVLASIRRVAGGDFNPGSPKQIAELLFEKLKLPVLQKTKTGPSTEAWVLEALRHQHELPDLLLQYRALSKLIGTYLARLPEWIHPRTGRIHTRFRQTGTETGRLSSDQPNLQNIPKKSDLGREMRGAFIAGKGRVFIAADYSQIELRVLAHLSGDPTLREAFRAKSDIHRFVAAQVHGISEAAVTPQQRNAAKAVNFGIIYGQTAYGLSQTLGIPRAQAQAFIDDYFARFAGVRTYIDRTIAEAAQLGYAATIAGRRRYIPQLASGNRNERLQGERIALNSTIQGSAADLIKRAMLACERSLPAGATLVLQIHDELLVEADTTVAAAAAAALTSAMIGAWPLSVELVAQARTGATWLDVS